MHQQTRRGAALLLALLAVLSSLALPARAESDPPTQKNQRAEAEVEAPDSAAKPAPDRALTRALHLERAALREATEARVAELAAQLEDATPGQQEDLQRQISALKSEQQVQDLQVQARFAREAGNEELALAMEARAQRLLEPVAVPTVKVDRPAPVREEGDR